MKQATSVAQVMSRSVSCIPERTALKDAIEAILEASHTILPVVDDAGRYKGIISPLDFFRRCFPLHTRGPYPDLGAIFADTVGTLARGGPTVSSSDTVQEAAKLLLSEKSYELPVVDDGRIVGIVSAKDALRFINPNGSFK